MLTASRLIAAIVLSGIAVSAIAEEFYIYPAKGQTKEQLEQDKFQCYSFAKDATGFDPMAPPTATAPAPQKEAPKGGAGSGLVKGALGGAVVGAIAGDTKKGAAIGGASGALIGGMRRSDQKKEEEHKQKQWEQEQVGQYAQNRSNYNRAYTACLEGRGYTVK